jgi:hypothetical protein
MLVAQLFLKAGQVQQAYAAARRATDIDPKDPRGWQFALVAATQLNQSDTVLALGKAALSAGVDKTIVGSALLGTISPAVKKASETKARADWEAVLTTAEAVDAIAPSPESKFYIGFSAFQIAADVMQELQPQVQALGKGTPKAADKAAACANAKTIEDYLAKTSVAMPAGGKVDANTAGQVLGAVTQYTDYTGQVKKAFCPK